MVLHSTALQMRRFGPAGRLERCLLSACSSQHSNWRAKQFGVKQTRKALAACCCVSETVIDGVNNGLTRSASASSLLPAALHALTRRGSSPSPTCSPVSCLLYCSTYTVTPALYNFFHPEQ